MNIYELVELGHDGEVYASYGYFSTYEKAENLKKQFDGYGGYGVCDQEDFDIIAHELDSIKDWVKDTLEYCKYHKARLENRKGS